MKKILYTLLLTILLPLAAAAKIPVEDNIADQINDPSSPFYYPNLYLRFNNGDTTLSDEEFHYLYYGFAYNEAYKPLEPTNKLDKVLLLASALDPESPTEQSLDDIVVATTDALSENPFSPNLWNLLAFAYGALGDKEREAMAFDRVSKILATIDSSGNGLKEKSPKHIIMFDHAIDLLTSQGINHKKATVISRSVEYIPFLETQATESGDKVKGLYFDFSRIYWNKPDNYEHKRNNTWQFNNIKPKN